MVNFSTRLAAATRAGVRTGLVVCYTELAHQNLLITNGPFLGPIQEQWSPWLELSMGSPIKQLSYKRMKGVESQIDISILKTSNVFRQ